jgi:hypothetical protein
MEPVVARTIKLRLTRWDREIEAGERWPNGETFNRICELYA